MQCPSCGHVADESSRYCAHCGVAVGLLRAADEERRLATVMFADVAGFTSRSESLDIEDVGAFLDPFHQLAATEVERYGGIVAKFIGDGVMALFGASTTHEDDPERCVRASLSIQHELARSRLVDTSTVRVRIGVASGEVLVRYLENGQTDAIGDTVNTAARLEAAAPVDGVIVGEATYKATRGVVRYRPADPILAKGKSNPVAAWVAEAIAETPIGEPATSALPFAGRQGEMEQLQAALHRGCSGMGTLVTIVAPAGLGKSRIVHELEHAGARSHPDARWHHGAASPHGGSAFEPFAQIVRSLLGGDTSSSQGQRARWLQASLRGVVEQPTAGWVEQHLGPLLGLPGADSAEDTREEAGAAWCRVVAAFAADEPRVLIFEDLHWAGQATLDFIHELMSRLGNAPVMIVCTGRPNGWEHRLGERATAALHLTPLAETESIRLLGDAMVPGSWTGSLDELVERCGGNPLFIREYAAMLAERSSSADTRDQTIRVLVPETVQAVIAARLDTLDPGERRAVQEAAVFGQVFWLSALSRLSGLEQVELERTVGRITRAGFIVPRPASTITGEREFAFSHGLTAEVAYSQMVRSRRARLHADAGAWLEEAAAGHEQMTEPIAHHYAVALELMKATKQDVIQIAGKARPAFERAAGRSFAVNDYESAASYYERALTACREVGCEEEATLLLAIGRARFIAQDAFPEALIEALDGLLARNDVHGAAEAEMLIGFWLGNHGRLAEGLPHTQRARELLSAEPPSHLKGEVALSLGERAVLAGDVEDGMHLCEEAIRNAGATHPELKAQALLALAIGRLIHGDISASTQVDAAIDSVSECRSPRAGFITMNAADVCRWLGRLQRSFEAQAVAAQRADELGSAFLRRLVAAEGVRSAWYAGDWRAAQAQAAMLIADIEAGQPLHLEPVLRLIRASLFLGASDIANAYADVHSALEHARTSGDPEMLLPSLASAARLFTIAGDPDHATLLLEEIADLCDSTPSFLWAPAAGDAAFAATANGRESLLRGAIATEPFTLWHEAALLILDHELSDAAQCFARIGSIPDQANVGLLAMMDDGCHSRGMQHAVDLAGRLYPLRT